MDSKPTVEEEAKSEICESLNKKNAAFARLSEAVKMKSSNRMNFAVPRKGESIKCSTIRKQMIKEMENGR